MWVNGVKLSFMGIELIAGLSVVSFFVFGFFVSLWVRNWSWVDVLWTLAFPVLFVALVIPRWPDLRRPELMALGAMYLLWSLRLAWHLSGRILKLHPEMEGRYLKLARQWKDHERRSFFAFFMAQAALVLVLGVPIFLVARGEGTSSGAWVIGVFVWIVAYGGEVVADAQLEAFKRAPGNRGKVCELGLWAYSRHPNYFFEWLMWVGYALVATFSHPLGWVAFLSPLLMLWLVTKVTGIPPTEAQSLRSRGEAFRDYQRRVSAFVPWKPKKG
jgi:steroid 5-alpha reductase family enzyme